MERGHAEALLPLIERVMAQVEGGFASLDRIAVTVGPGSFTGIRVAISAARRKWAPRVLSTIAVALVFRNSRRGLRIGEGIGERVLKYSLGPKAYSHSRKKDARPRWAQTSSKRRKCSA
jgi:hypothetical protein